MARPALLSASRVVDAVLQHPHYVIRAAIHVLQLSTWNAELTAGGKLFELISETQLFYNSKSLPPWR